MNLDELRSVQNAERNRGGLQPLRESFYEEVGQYIADLKVERDRVAERADDPWSSPEVKRLTDEIQTAEEVVEAIYERRMGKILERASLAAAEMSADEEGLTAEERALFSDLVGRIRENKRTVLDVLDADSVAGPTEERETTGDAGATGETGATGDAGTTGETAATGDAEPREASGPSRTRVDPDPPPGAEAGTDARHRETAGHRDAEPRADDLSTADAMGAGPDRADADATAGSSPGGGAASPDDARDDAGTTPDDARDDAGTTPDDAGASSGDASRGDAGTSRDDGGAAAGGAGTGEDHPEATDRVTVRITRDVGPILGIDDRQYVLEPEDVVELPAENADPLVERDAAQKLE